MSDTLKTHMQQLKSELEDAQEAKRRAEWLHGKNAPSDWIILTIGEVRELRAELNAANAEIKRLKNITASGIHTCSEQCQRPMCVMRRQLRDANAKITELEEQLENLKPSDFDPYDPA